MAEIIHPGKARTISISFLNEAGGPGVVEGSPVYTASPDGMVTLIPAADGLTCEVVHDLAAFGDVDIFLKADGDLSSEVFVISKVIRFTLAAPLGAVDANVSVSEEHDAPVPAAA